MKVHENGGCIYRESMLETGVIKKVGALLPMKERERVGE